MPHGRASPDRLPRNPHRVAGSVAHRLVTPVLDTDALRAARSAYDRDDLPRTRRLLEAVLAQAPDNAEGHNLLGNVHLREGRPTEAAECYRRAVAADPGHTKAHFNLGLAALEAGRPQEAARAIETALALAPGAAEDHLLLGNILHGLGRETDAIAHWRTAVARAPGLVAGWVNLGSLLRARGEFPAALEALTRAVELAPELGVAHLELGLVRHASGDHAGAIVAFRRAAELDPEAVAPRVNLAEALRHAGRTDEARAVLAEAAAAHPGDGAVHKALGLLALTDGDRDAAAHHYRSAQGRLPDDPEIAHLLAAAEGRSVASAPAAYVRALFDDFADRFDHELVDHLRYDTPRVLAEALRAALPRPGVRLRLVDLGCGTGLAGAALAELALDLVGVDLLPRMLEHARARGIYSQLACDDLVAFLSQCPAGRFDGAVAADVFNYVGRLDDALAQLGRVLDDAGLLAFSLETHEHPGNDQAVLTPSGRFAHRVDAVLRAAAVYGFSVMRQSRVVLRMDRGLPVAGAILVLRKG
jgi:predicted TPR repeat methyltransferase